MRWHSLLMLLMAAALAGAAFDAARAQGPELVVERTGDAFAVYLDGGDLNGLFNVVDVNVVPGAGESFLNVSASGAVGTRILLAGEQATFVSAWLDPGPIFDRGWSILGKQTTVDQIRFAGGPLGGVIDTSAASPGTFLFNVMPSRSFTATVDLYDAGLVAARLTASGVVPEPATVLLAGGAGVLLALRQRWRNERRPGRS